MLIFQWIDNMFTTLNGGSSIRIRGYRGWAVEKELQRIAQDKLIRDYMKTRSHSRVSPVRVDQVRSSPYSGWQTKDQVRPHVIIRPTPSTNTSSSNGDALPNDDNRWNGCALKIGFGLILFVTFLIFVFLHYTKNKRY